MVFVAKVAGVSVSSFVGQRVTLNQFCWITGKERTNNWMIVRVIATLASRLIAD